MVAVLFGGACCALCGEELRVDGPMGWVHPNGLVLGPDDHAVVPITRAAYVAGRGG